MPQFNFWCENRLNVESCSYCSLKGDLSIICDEEDKFQCPIDSSVDLKKMGQKGFTIKNSFGGRTLSGKELTDHLKPQRQKRNSDHFKNEILPTLGDDEKRHWREKTGNKNLGR